MGREHQSDVVKAKASGFLVSDVPRDLFIVFAF